MAGTIYWHDYETFGTSPATDWPSQFAGLRTDLELNEIDEPPLVHYCAPPDDQLPAPDACLVTGITPQLARERGSCEAEFIARIQQAFSVPGTCVAGYNSLRFDDEVTRHSLYRNFYDPYAREWQNGNSRWDIIDLVRLTEALRPEGIIWPQRDDGLPSFRLEALTAANGIAHEAAHDALSDVRATVAMARLIRERQPRLYEFAFAHRQKQRVARYLNPQQKTPLVHVSGRYPASRHCLALVLPIAPHPENKNGVVVVDLASDPELLLSLEVEELRRRLYTPAAELADGDERPGLKTVHINRCPLVAPINVLRAEDIERLGLDMGQMKRHYERLLAAPELVAKLQQVMASPEREPHRDPDHMLYSGGFFGPGDRERMEQVRRTAADQLAQMEPAFEDLRLEEMLFRYRARNYPETLSPAEQGRWQQFRQQRLCQAAGGGGRTLSEYFGRIEQLRMERADEQSQQLLNELQRWGEQLQQGLD
ncbi:exodeoxyribonuclease I [Aestuariirhabdus litorea]|uniref:Exodeoxyribonuclease I n=1 Tax=Aestuariirhabdus litorea TaxID=2528527 RepID=A0A3P3VMR9_9GAMM|nr:exodeoxyribonuclease I [Aestuariirhabdus litorea]RRJ83910.1 exodeoxyribonuclease I [Aestuariirhabdus litorea]RWW97133.1 exodeoxyribonuclease I [Endozoicomonadaceae bacterium GTF-13]